MNFEKLNNFVQYYKKLINKDPFIALNILPPSLNVDNSPNNIYSKFITKQGKEYLDSLTSCFLFATKQYKNILTNKDKNKSKGFKISEPKVEISTNSILKAIFQEYQQDKLKAAEKFELSQKYFKEKNYIEAQKALEEAFKYDPNNSYIINNLFITSYLTGKTEILKELLKIMTILGFKESEFFTN